MTCGFSTLALTLLNWRGPMHRRMERGVVQLLVMGVLAAVKVVVTGTVIAVLVGQGEQGTTLSAR